MNHDTPPSQSTHQESDPWYWSPIGAIAFALAAPYYLVRIATGKKYRAGLRQRLTLFDPETIQRLKSGSYIWVHAVSVGELMAARPLIRRIKQEFPDRKILVTTVTETGQGEARKAEEVDESIYLPLDLYPLCKRVMEWVRPACLLIMETELWPNLIRSAHNAHAPFFLINARLSDKSFHNYNRFRKLFAPLLNLFSRVLAQSDEDRNRFLQLGAPSENVLAMGNLKFEAVPTIDGGETRSEWRERFQIDDGEILLLGGSTFPGEESILAALTAKLRGEGIPLRLIIAPRHIERADEIVEELKAYPFPIARRSTLKDGNNIDNEAILLLDTIGELRYVYAAADVVFIGKSICGKGGQNPIEAAAWGKPIVFGKNMQNFRDVAALFLRADAARSVKDERALVNQCRTLCQSPDERDKLGRKAREVVSANQGALDCVIETIRPFVGRVS